MSVVPKMIQIKTPLTARLNITTPIISAPMAEVATAELAAAVTAAGGLGSIGAGYSSTSVLKEQIQKIRTSLDIPAGNQRPMIPVSSAVLDELPAAVWFAFGVDLGKYIDQVHGARHQNSAQNLRIVIVSSGVDAVVVQAVLTEFKSSGGPLVVAAGGISTGAQIAALLTMGADGVALGTRFLFTPECAYSPAKKEALIKADLGATFPGLPIAMDGISNKIIDDYKAGLGVEERIAKFDESGRNGDDSRLIIWAGAGAGLTSEIKGAE
ncbi:hypothetical protein B0H13DRAFT_2061732 [Mycena leptocephala]|nr:hypothetical protein B0H13DRAFT_2061732 [Mycena leptocephala]